MLKFEEDTNGGIDLNMMPDLRVHCSVCLESVDHDTGKSTAKLQCGHEFHLDCIGSAFNVKGIMQCPNCRNIEKGQWLYAMGSANATSDFSMDSWNADQNPFFLLPYGFHICPFRGLVETDDPSNSDHPFYRNHDGFGEDVSPSSPGPTYLTYFRDDNEHMDGLNLSTLDESHRQNEGFASQTFPSTDIHYPTWMHQSTSSYATGSHMIESTNHNLSAEMDTVATSTFPSHLFSSSQSVQTGSSSTTMVDVGGTQALHPLSIRPDPTGGIPLTLPPNVRRSNGSRGVPAFLPAGRPYDARPWFYYPPPTPNYLHPLERGVHSPLLPNALVSNRWLRHR